MKNPFWQFLVMHDNRNDTFKFLLAMTNASSQTLAANHNSRQGRQTNARDNVFR